MNEELREAVRKTFIGITASFKRQHKHRWETTHTNKWQIPTIQVCECGLSRQTSIEGCASLRYRWEYSDGTKSPEYPLGEGVSCL